MKKLPFWIILLSFAKLIVAELFVVSNLAKSSGNFLNSNQKFKEVYCITDDLDSALVWNYHLDWQFTDFENSDETHGTYCELLKKNSEIILCTSILFLFYFFFQKYYHVIKNLSIQRVIV